MRSAACPRRPRRGFNGATANSPWRTSRRRSGGGSRRRSFNGATANSPWRTRRAGGPRRRRLASMGPRRIRRGEHGSVEAGWSGRACFNGATANSPWRTPLPTRPPRTAPRRLQWGHGEFAVENVVSVMPSPVAMAALQWGHGEFAVENRTGSAGGRGISGASMGPRRIRRGERLRQALHGSRVRRFNGATANSPWRTCDAQGGPKVVAWLQWGHGEFAVENPTGKLQGGPARDGFNGATANSPWRTARGGGRPAAAADASMGPRRIRRGERIYGRCPGEALMALQWGHGEFAVENSAGTRTRRASWPSFNGATANSPWRTTGRGYHPSSRSRSLQWGHGEFAVENPQHRRPGDDRPDASMGPRRIRRGEHQ